MPTFHNLASKSLLLSLAGAAALLAAPDPAHACGGTFCDAGPTVMPVDQTGESIVFWIDESGAEPYTEAHIQIEYEGDAERFAWIIPVMEVPEVLVGSQTLFDNLLAATVPTFTTNTRTIGDCFGGGGVGFGCGDDASSFAGGDFASGGFGTEGGGSDTMGGPEILDRGVAGAFEYVTLTGSSIDEIVEWLDTFGYAQDEDAPPILEEYLEEGFVFTAVKLQSGAGVNEIHPLAIRYPGTEPCIPIRLTRIAAIDDMAIRAFFLGESRVAPSNWPHVVLNPSRFDWVNGPETNYNEVVGLAIDEAGGRAFVTEYAGTDAVVSTSGVYDSRWDPADFEGIGPEQVVPALVDQGLMTCTQFDGCFFSHLQVEPLLQTYLPVPDGVNADTFYECVECFAELVDQEAWAMAPGFAADFADRISTPGLHAVEMLDDASTLTRLFTLLSPHEMIEDPLFHPTDLSSTVDNNITATQVTDCDGGPTYYELPDGRIIAQTETGTMPDLEGNPAAAAVEQVPMSGPAQTETDNGGVIDEVLEAYNKDRRVGPQSGCSIGRTGLEGLLTMMALFGIVFVQRRRRS